MANTTKPNAAPAVGFPSGRIETHDGIQYFVVRVPVQSPQPTGRHEQSGALNVGKTSTFVPIEAAIEYDGFPCQVAFSANFTIRPPRRR